MKNIEYQSTSFPEGERQTLFVEQDVNIMSKDINKDLNIFI